MLDGKDLTLVLRLFTAVKSCFIVIFFLRMHSHFRFMCASVCVYVNTLSFNTINKITTLYTVPEKNNLKQIT